MPGAWTLDPGEQRKIIYAICWELNTERKCDSVIFSSFNNSCFKRRDSANCLEDRNGRIQVVLWMIDWYLFICSFHKSCVSVISSRYFERNSFGRKNDIYICTWKSYVDIDSLCDMINISLIPWLDTYKLGGAETLG